MGTTVNGIYLPALGEKNGWDDEVNANFQRLGEVGINVRGAPYNAAASDAAAINLAIDDLPAEGGTILCPGSFSCDSTLDLAGRRSVILKGSGGLSAGATPASQLVFTGTGAGSLIDARESFGVWVQDMSVIYTSSSFTGCVIDFRNASGADTAYAGVDRCMVGGNGGVATAVACVALDKAIIIKVSDSSLAGAVVGVMGRSAAGTYSNRIKLDGVTFQGMTIAAIKNAGQAWNIQSCTFNPITSGTAGAILHDAGVAANGVSIQGCWFGDVTSGSGTHIMFEGGGLNVIGNYIGGNAGITALGLDANACEGIIVMGNTFDTHLNAIKTNVGGAGAHIGTYFLGNRYTGVTNKLVGALGTPGQRDDGANLFTTSNVQVDGGATISTSLAHLGNSLGFYSTSPIGKQTGVAVSAAGVHAALVNLGLISA